MIKKPKLILHAGTHKTGTTSLQYALSENRAYLNSVGVSYPSVAEAFNVTPSLPSARAHFAVADAVARFGPRDRKRLMRFFRRLHQESLGSDRIILSAESIYRHEAQPLFAVQNDTPIDKRVRFLERLAAVVCAFDTELLLYLRRVDRFATSLYTEAVVGPTTASFQDFLTANAMRFDYRLQIDLFSLYFPVQVRNFEASARSGLVDTFCIHAGIPAKLPDTPDRPRPSVPNTAALWLLREKRAREMHKIERRRRWHFALLPESAELFEKGAKTGFWNDTAERDAFIERHQSQVPEVDFPHPTAGVDPLATWSDAQHRDAERRFQTWQDANRTRLEQREANKIPPHALDA